VAARPPVLATITIMIVGAPSIVTYLVLPLVTNAQPSTAANTGWVALLQPGSPSGSGQILLQAEPVVPGAPGDHPDVIYSVLACGDHPFRGVLLLGGQAQLDDPVVTDQHMVSSTNSGPSTMHMTAVPGLTLSLLDTVWRLGPGQEIPVAIDQPGACLGPTSTDQPFTVATTVRGLAQGPIQRRGSFAGISGPHTSQAWPLIGGFPTSLPGITGLFTGITGLKGIWAVPAVLHRRVAGGSLTARATVDGAIPPLSDSTKTVWDSTAPIRATVRVTNIDDLAWWQNWLMGSGIFLGVGGSLLASLLFEWLQAAHETTPPTSSNIPALHARATEPELKTHRSRKTSAPTRAATLATVVILAVVAYVLGRTRR
jgi:hypothetical protein